MNSIKIDTNAPLINDTLNVSNILSELHKLDRLLNSLDIQAALIEYETPTKQALQKLLNLKNPLKLKEIHFIDQIATATETNGWDVLWSLVSGAALSTALIYALAYPIAIPFGSAAAVSSTVNLGSFIIGTFIFSSLFLSGKNSAHEFSQRLNLATKLYEEAVENNDRNKLIHSENILHDLLDENQNNTLLQSFFRWFYMPEQQLPLTHFLYAEIGLHLNKEYPLEEFETALAGPLVEHLKHIAILRQTAILLKKNTRKNIQQFEINQPPAVLQQKITQLMQTNSCHIYFANVYQAYQNIIAAINAENAELTHYTMSKFLLIEDFELMRQLEHGATYIVFFNFVKSLCAAEIYAHPQTNSDYKLKLRINCIELLISCYEQIKQQEELQFNPLLKEIKTHCETILQDIKNFNDIPRNMVRQLIALGIKEDPCVELSEDEVIELLSHTNHPVTSLHDLIIKITTEKNFALLQFSDGKNWLHYLPRIDFPFELSDDARIAAAHIIAMGVSPYARDKQHKTAFQYIPIRDHNGIEPIFRPSADGADFIGLDNQKKSIANFLQRTLDNPNSKSRLLLLSGPPGVGKTELTKVMASKVGFTVLEFHGGTAEDKWVGGRETRIREFFKDAISKNEPVVIFMDEIDSICSEVNGGEMHDLLKDELSNLLQTQIDQLIGSQVVVIGATNYLEKVKKAIRSRAGTPVHFNLPNDQYRAKIIKDKLRLIDIPDESIIYDLAMATNHWSPRDIEKYLLDVQESAEHENRFFLTAQDFERVISNKNKSLLAKQPTTLFGYNQNKTETPSDETINTLNGPRPSP